MKVARSTRQRIETIKAEATQHLQGLLNLKIRLEEHSGTKRIARQLDAVILRLDEWKKAA